MILKPEDLKTLYDPTPTDEVKQRQGPRKHEGVCPKFGACPQKHMMLDYVDARYVMEKLDHLGPENWQDMFIDLPDGSVRCGIGIKVGEEWVWKWDVGTASDIEPVKGAYSEAFKRAGVKWGVARDLYGHKAGTSAVRPAAPVVVQRPATPAPVASLPAEHPRSATPAAVASNEPPEISDEELASLTGGSAPAQRSAPQRASQTQRSVGDLCPEHNEPWRGEIGDLYHKSSQGYCRPEGQPRKAR